jgi:hypothetical protein
MVNRYSELSLLYTELSIVLLVLVIVSQKQLEGHAPGYGDCYVCSSTPFESMQSPLLPS